jgi:glycosyltransferase involved in cell wall biosynthesis
MRSALKRIVLKNRISFHEKINKNLYIITPPVFPYSEEFGKIRKLNVIIGSFFLKHFLTKKKIENYIAWFYDPEAVQYLDYLKPECICYDCVDEFSAMPSYKDLKRKESLINDEIKLMTNCNVVFTTSLSLYDAKKQYNQSTYLVENVGDFSHFHLDDKISAAIPADFPEGKGPVLIFIGAVDPYKVDFDVLENMALQRPHWRILLIGNVQDSSNSSFKFPVNKNFFYLGHKEYSLLPRYLLYSDVCLIPYCINEYTKGVFPIKLFEYLATGKPVVTTALPSLSKYKSIIQMADSSGDFISEVETALTNDSAEKKKERIDFAKKNTWEHRANTLMQYVSQEIKENQNAHIF